MKITDISSSSENYTHHSDEESNKDTQPNRHVDRKRTLLEKYNIPVEHLDFDYVNKCNDGRKIEKILKVLRSGQEGVYPDLEKCVQEKLLLLNPKCHLLQVETPVLRTNELVKDERDQLNSNLNAWIKEVSDDFPSSSSASLLNQIFADDEDTDDQSCQLPVRGSSEQMVVEMSNKMFTPVKDGQSSERIKSWEYDKWERYDADAELTKFDIVDMQSEEWEKIEKPAIIQDQKRIENLMKPSSSTGLSRRSVVNAGNNSSTSIQMKASNSGDSSSRLSKSAVRQSFVEEIYDEDEEGTKVTPPVNFNRLRKKTVIIDDLNIAM